MCKRRVSSRDVAREAGVSQATVSYVLNNVEGVKIKPETREAVLQAAKKLNYHPDLIARSMKLKKSMSIGVVTDKNITDYWFTKALEGVKDALVPKNYSLTLCFDRSEDVESSEYIRYYNSNRIDGIVFVFSSITELHIEYLTDNNIPFVVIRTDYYKDMMHLVKSELSGAVKDAVRHLVDRQIDKIAYFGRNAGNTDSRKFKAYSDALQSFNINKDERFLLRMSDDYNEYGNKFDKYFSTLNSMPSAVICENMQTGFRLLKFAAARRISIPEKMSVVAMGTSRHSDLIYPSLSTIEAPIYDMGFKGALMLIDMIRDGNVKSDGENDTVIIEWKYMPRESS